MWQPIPRKRGTRARLGLWWSLSQPLLWLWPVMGSGGTNKWSGTSSLRSWRACGSRVASSVLQDVVIMGEQLLGLMDVIRLWIRCLLDWRLQCGQITGSRHESRDPDLGGHSCAQNSLTKPFGHGNFNSWSVDHGFVWWRGDHIGLLAFDHIISRRSRQRTNS